MSDGASSEASAPGGVFPSDPSRDPSSSLFFLKRTMARSIFLVLVAADASSPSGFMLQSPALLAKDEPRSYWRLQEDQKMTKHWHKKGMPEGAAHWTQEQRMAVRKALATERRLNAGKLPKVFVYPFPEEFADPAFVRAKLNATNYWDALKLEKFDHGPETERWEEEQGLLRWTPSFAAVSAGKAAYRAAEKKGTPNDDCKKRHLREKDPQDLEDGCVLRPSQHNLGLVVHRGLATSYSELVTDPAEADLFFIPDYSDRWDPEWCQGVGKAWDDHLRTNFGHDYLSRKNGTDHFVVIGRTFHWFRDITASYAWKRSVNESQRRYDCPYRREWNVHKLRLEAQDPFVRICGKVAPIPYAGFLSWTQRPSFGRAWFGAMEQPKRHKAAALFSVDDPRKDPTRQLMLDACKRWSGCVDVDKVALDSDEAGETFTGRNLSHVDFEATYRDALFSLQPPGLSAGRKGIVDSILAGSIPVLIKEEDSEITRHRSLRDVNKTKKTASLTLYFRDQRDLWPWHWPAQGASSIILTRDDIDVPGRLEAILNSVDDEQLHLMHAVLRVTAPGLAWPLHTPIAPSAPSSESSSSRNALDLTMHHLGTVVASSARRHPHGIEPPTCHEDNY